MLTRIVMPTVMLVVAFLVLSSGAATAQPAACGLQPAFDCRTSAKSKVVVQQKDGTKDKLVWNWPRGAATDVADFGDPSAATGYAVCVYAGNHSTLVGEAVIPAGAGWTPAGTKGFKYKDKTGSADGILKVLLRAGSDGNTKLSVKGKGANLPDPTFPPALPLRVQLVNGTTSACWEDVYDGTDVVRNDGVQLKAKAGDEIPGAPLPVLWSPGPLPAMTAAEAGVPAYVGAPATAQPMAPLVLPTHPFLAPQGDSRIHNDGENSAVYNRPGPLGVNPVITTASLLEGSELTDVCAMSAFTPEGYLIAACLQVVLPAASTSLVMMDPGTLDVYASTLLAPRPLIQNSAGGAYFSIDDQGRIIIGPSNNAVEIWELSINGGTPAFIRRASYDVSGLLAAGDLLQDTVVDWQGRLWFASTLGIVGYVDPDTGDVETFDTGEGLQNSFAVDAAGVYIVTFDAMYRFSVAGDGSVQQDWRTPYDNSGPGLLQPGSGTTPTLFGTLGDLVGFSDTAEPQINMVILDRTTGAEVCLTPLFRAGESGAENTFLAYGDDVVIVNNAGFVAAFLPQNPVRPGIERHQVRGDRTGCDVVWVNDTSIGNSAQLSTSTGLIYGWAPDPDVSTLDAYYFTANDWATGDEVFRVYVGNDQPFNPVLGQPHIGLDGAAYVGSLQGIIRIADGP